MYKRIAYKVRNELLKNFYQVPFFRRQAEINYQAAQEKHIGSLPSLSDFDTSVVETLIEKGLVMTSLEELLIPSTQEMLNAAKELIPKIPGQDSLGKNEYVVHASPQQIMEHFEIFLWGLEQRLLAIVENYIQVPVAYHGMYFRRDVANNVQRKSRLWHIDPEDRKVLKIIVYLNDVDENNGPFEYIPQSLTSKVASALNYNEGYVSDNTMDKVLSASNWISCTGVSGTVILAATSKIFHRGKVPISSDRFTVFFDYTSRKPRVHYYYGTSFLKDKDLQWLGKYMNQQQKECVFWRSHP